MFIRHQLGDVKSSLILLPQLQTIYIATENKKETLTKDWIEELSNHAPGDRENLFTGFDSYPRLESALHQEALKNSHLAILSEVDQRRPKYPYAPKSKANHEYHSPHNSHPPTGVYENKNARRPWWS